MEEVILLDLKIDQAFANKSLDSVLQKQSALITNTKELTAEQKKLQSQGDTNSQTYIANSKQIEINKEALRKNKQEVSALTKSLEAEDNSVEALVASNKKLIQERNKTNGATEAGQKKIASLNSQLDKNNAAIKSNVSGLEKQKINIGNYGSALDGIIPGLGATASGFKANAAAMWLMVANPLGITLAALGLIIAGIMKYLTGSAEGQDKLNKIMAIGGAVVGKLSDAISFLGEYAIKAVLGYFDLWISAIEYIVPGFRELINLVGEKLNEALGDPTALANLKNRNDLLERELVLLKANSEARIAELKLKAEDKSLDLVVRQQALREALDLQAALSEKQTEFAQNKLDIAIQETAQSVDDKAALLEKVQLEADLILIRKDAADKSKEISIKEQELRKQLNAERALEDGNARATRRQQITTEAAEELSIQSIHQNEKLKLETKFNDAIAEGRAALHKNDIKNAKLANEENKILLEQRQQNIFASIGAISDLLGAFRNRSKTAASAQAGINTFLGVTEILKSPAAPFIEPFASVIRAAKIATTLKVGFDAIRQINNAKFEQGGAVKSWTLGGKDHSRGGTRFVGSDGTKFEAQRGEGLFVLKREAHQDLLHQLSKQNTKFGGIPLTGQSRVRHAAQGGEIAVANIQSINGGGDLTQIVDAIKQLQVVVGVEEIVTGLSNRAQVVELTTPIS